MPHTASKRYAVVSCHVERPLDDRVWARFARLQARRPGGFRIAALLRPPDRDAGEDARTWISRARQAASQGPLGHHTHWGGPEAARPPAGSQEEPAARVRREAAWFREAGLEPRLFCGGGWYLDSGVAEALGELGYADCTATAFAPAYLSDGAARGALRSPAWLRLGTGRLLELPTTHSLGAAARAAIDPRPIRLEVVHVYFHDTDLLDGRRRLALRAALAILGRRRRPTDLEQLADEVSRSAPEVELASVLLGGARTAPDAAVHFP